MCVREKEVAMPISLLRVAGRSGSSRPINNQRIRNSLPLAWIELELSLIKAAVNITLVIHSAFL
jgi:hypothetical protein